MGGVGRGAMSGWWLGVRSFSCMTNRVYESINTWGEGIRIARLGQEWGRFGVVSGLLSATIYSSLEAIRVVSFPNMFWLTHTEVHSLRKYADVADVGIHFPQRIVLSKPYA